MYAIRNKKTGRWITGTDYRYSPPHQITSDDMAIIYANEELARFALRARRCGKCYEVVPVRLEVIQ